MRVIVRFLAACVAVESKECVRQHGSIKHFDQFRQQQEATVSTAVVDSLTRWPETSSILRTVKFRQPAVDSFITAACRGDSRSAIDIVLGCLSVCLSVRHRTDFMDYHTDRFF